ncbi:hypothetical protein J4E91_002767 [Alternaria rosae]|nr:hypothetical protein J4E91_002767 [Alternaria rosae]
MAEGLDIVALPGIAALPPTTARQIGSGQVLVDPSSVVKELIDNALDARAKSILVDITANTVDSIQVKDDGHGIPAEDRPLVCRRYCTSKIRDLHDLREVGGKWLGFRGEALSSMADMSGSLSVTTRVEGEPVAVKLKYGRNSELASTEHDSHPVGTTVKVTKFFDFIPVRKETAIRNSAKLLAKIRRLMQAYALARPTIRFRLRVLKAKNNNGDFVYAPKADANIEDAALKVIGKDCALQCDWTVLEAEGFEIHAFLPKPGASGPKIAHQGSFVSIDARPVSSIRGTAKRIITTYKDRLRKSTPSLAGVKDPFFCMNIICPPDSYDPNIESAKDDVMFNNSEVVVAVVDKLLKAYYPEAIQDIADVQDTEIQTSAQQQYEPRFEKLPSRVENSITIHEDELANRNEQSTTDPAQALPHWRSSMYGIDEDDLEFLQENPAPVVEEGDEVGLRAVEVSNPWTIARMNTTIKPKQAVSNEQLLSPAKSQRGVDLHLNSTSPAVTPRRSLSAAPLTPQTLSKTNMRSPLDTELERSIQHAWHPSSEAGALDNGTQERDTDSQGRHERIGHLPQTGTSSHFARSDINSTQLGLTDYNHIGKGSQRLTSPVTCRTTDALERTKSSKLPLERTPDGFHIQDLVLRISTSIQAIMQCSHKLDMQRNSPEWGYASESAYDVFDEPVLEKKIMGWVISLDALLCKRYEKIDGADTRCEMHEGIQRALDARKEADDDMRNIGDADRDRTSSGTEASEYAVPKGVGAATSMLVQQTILEDEKKVHNDGVFDFDMEEFVDLTGGDERQTLGVAGEGIVEEDKVKGEFDDDIEDEMLMDL